MLAIFGVRPKLERPMILIGRDNNIDRVDLLEINKSDASTSTEVEVYRRGNIEGEIIGENGNRRTIGGACDIKVEKIDVDKPILVAVIVVVTAIAWGADAGYEGAVEMAPEIAGVTVEKTPDLSDRAVETTAEVVLEPIGVIAEMIPDTTGTAVEVLLEIILDTTGVTGKATLKTMDVVFEMIAGAIGVTVEIMLETMGTRVKITLETTGITIDTTPETGGINPSSGHGTPQCRALIGALM